MVSTGATSSPTSVIAAVRGRCPRTGTASLRSPRRWFQLPQFVPHADLLRRFHQTAKVNYRHLRAAAGEQ